MNATTRQREEGDRTQHEREARRERALARLAGRDAGRRDPTRPSDPPDHPRRTPAAQGGGSDRYGNERTRETEYGLDRRKRPPRAEVPTAEEGKAGGMLGLPGTTGSEGHETLADGVLRSPTGGLRAARLPRCFQSPYVRPSHPEARPSARFASLFPVTCSPRTRPDSTSRSAPAPPARTAREAPIPRPPATHSRLPDRRTVAPTRRSMSRLRRIECRLRHAILEGARRKPAHPLQYWTGEGWGHFDSARFCGVGGPGKAKERSQ